MTMNLRQFFRILALLHVVGSILPADCPDASNYKPAQRFALVIGNSSYLNGNELTHPLQDATDFSNALQKAGFSVDLKTNLIKADMIQAIKGIRARVGPTTEFIFYYAGHAAQLNDNNYLLPIDTQLNTIDDLQNEGVTLNELMGVLFDNPPQTSLIILDACRDNPFLHLVRERELIQQGLAPVEQNDAPFNTLIAFATAPGKVAEDGQGRNSPYTYGLLKVLKEPGLRIEDVFQKVRVYVKDATQEEQIPWENTSLLKLFYFYPPIILQCRVENADDSAAVYVNGAVIANSSDARWHSTNLHIGKNFLQVQVYNQKTRRNNHFWEPREGWRYTVRVCAGGKEKIYEKAEEEPPEERWGMTFVADEITLNVDAESHEVSLP